MAQAQLRATAEAPRQLLSREERQASILAAAATTFARAGFAATSMDDVAAAAGITKLIVYRHFASKEELYRAVLTQVATRLHEEFVARRALPEGERRGFATRAMLSVARENPDGYRLLTVHAAREPQFAETHRLIREAAYDIAREMIGERIPDATIRDWAARTIVEYLESGVIEWLDVGDPARDDEFVELATAGLVGMFTAWAGPL
jgi:AcrR family transcriptional regulator